MLGDSAVWQSPLQLPSLKRDISNHVGSDKPFHKRSSPSSSSELLACAPSRLKQRLFCRRVARWQLSAPPVRVTPCGLLSRFHEQQIPACCLARRHVARMLNPQN